MALLQVRSIPIRPGLLSNARILFNRAKRGILPKFHRQLVLCDNDESSLVALLKRQPQASQE